MQINKLVKQFSLLILLILGVILARYILDKRSEKLLTNSDEAFAYFQGSSYIRSSGWVTAFNYKIKGQDYYLKTGDKISFLEKGDTILIEYSVKDPSVAKVVELYYMEKYKHLRDSVELK